jgi:hypothetical protein
MSKRIFLAGILGGLAMFLWQSVAHMVLPFGGAGIREIPNEPAVLAAMHSALGGASGMYLFPGQGAEGMKNYDKKLAANPSGLLIYHPPGGQGMSPVQLIVELLTELLEAVLAVWLLSRSRAQTFGGRVGFVFTLGVVAGIATNVSYWNWYGFPASYTANYIGMQLAGFLAAGLVAAAVLRPVKFAMYEVATPVRR